MFIIPLSTDLRLGRQPWVTWVVMLICVVVFGFQYTSNQTFSHSITTYCQGIANEARAHPDDLLSQDIYGCTVLLYAYHIETNRGEAPETVALHILESMEGISEEEFTRLIKSLRKHYLVYRDAAPPILDEKLIYFPESFNPFTMITSSLAHAGFWHILGNLIFFFAFSPAIELLVGGALRYILSLTAIAVACSVFYSLFALAEGTNAPGLGLSGVVMGVIGMSAYLMPHARINTLIWFILPIWRTTIPAWFMATWFIGFDAWKLLSEGMNNGINLVAHVSGGVVGYLIAWYFFKTRKEDVQDELNEEIEYMKNQTRSLTINNMASLHRDMRTLQKNDAELQERKEQGAYLDRLFIMVRSNQNSAAINLIIADANPLALHPDHFKELFIKIGEWKKNRAYVCMGRLMIDLYMQHRRYADAFKIVKDCLEVTRTFVLANPRDVLLLAQEANRQQLYKLATAILYKVEERYSEEVGYIPCGLLEVDILVNHLNMPGQANKRLEELKALANPAELENIATLQATIVPMEQ
jgi:membrane associated rhomboid family serine protease